MLFKIIDEEHFDDYNRLQAKVRGFVPTLPKSDVDSEYDDLYLRVTPDTTEFVNNFIKYKGLSALCTIFRSEQDNDLWYKIKFGNVWQSVKPTGYAIERRTDFSRVNDSVEEYMTLYHNTTLEGIEGILCDMEIANDKYHSNGHGNMVWFSDMLGDYDNVCTISLKVPIDEIGTRYDQFNKMNNHHYVSYNSIDLTKYDFDIVKIASKTTEQIYEMIDNIKDFVISKGNVEDWAVDGEVRCMLIKCLHIDGDGEENPYLNWYCPNIIDYIDRVIFGL